MTSSKNPVSVDQLLKDAEPRARLSPETEQEMYESLHAHWRTTVSANKRSKWTISVAATLLAGLLAMFYALQDSTPAADPSVLVARVEAQFGVDAGSALAELLATSPGLMSDQMVRTTANTRLALDLAGGGKLRLNEHTAVRLVGRQNVELLRGSVYYDSNDKAPAILDGLYQKNSVVIHTPFGQVTNKGTQFLVDTNPDRLVVTVRSGLVDLAAGTRAIAIESGKQLVLGADHTQKISDVTPYGDSWSWVEQTLPEFNLNQAPLTLLLEWVEHETGREVVFSSDEAMQLAQTSVLVGKVDLLPLDALQLWIETVDLVAEVSDKQITIALKQ